MMERSGARGVARWVSLRRNCTERLVLALVEGLIRPALLTAKAGVVGVWGEDGVGGVLEAIVDVVNWRPG